MLAQHQLYEGQLDSALELVEKAINHTPTFHELYLVQAKIYKKQQQWKQAF